MKNLNLCFALMMTATLTAGIAFGYDCGEDPQCPIGSKADGSAVVIDSTTVVDSAGNKIDCCAKQRAPGSFGDDDGGAMGPPAVVPGARGGSQVD